MDPTFLKILYAGCQSCSSKSYYYDNSVRGTDPLTCVVQRTVEGCGFIEIDGITHKVRAEQAMLFIQGEDSRYGYFEKQRGVYQLEFVALGGSLIRPVFERVRDKLGPVFALSDETVAEVSFKNVMDCYIQRENKNPFEESRLVYEFLLKLLQYGGDKSKRMDPVDRAKEYILHNYQIPITQEDVATHVGISREHLARSYTERFMISPGRHCAALRMERAQILLRIANVTIEQVAIHCGYTEPSSFGRAFKTAYGMSPSEFRLNR